MPFGARFVGVPLGAPFVVVPWCGLSGVLWVLPVSVSCAGRLGPVPRAFVRAGCSPFARGVRAAVSFLFLSLVFLFCRVAWYFSSPAMWSPCVCVSPALLRPPPVRGALVPPFGAPARFVRPPFVFGVRFALPVPPPGIGQRHASDFQFISGLLLALRSHDMQLGEQKQKEEQQKKKSKSTARAKIRSSLIGIHCAFSMPYSMLLLVVVKLRRAVVVEQFLVIFVPFFSAFSVGSVVFRFGRFFST